MKFGKYVAIFIVIQTLATSQIFADIRTSDRIVLTQKLQEYCRACHALGQLRFIKSNDPNIIWNTLYREMVPGTKVLWKDAIVSTLSWPKPTPPSQESERIPGKKWMPIGYKRTEIASSRIGNENVREFMIRVLSNRDLAFEVYE